MTSHQHDHPQKLSEFELDVMSLLWDEQPLSAPQMHKLIVAKRQVSYSTVKTIIDRLEAKQAIERHSQVGRTILYAPIIKQASLSKPIVKGFLDRLFDGNPKNMIAHLIENQDLDQKDIALLQAMLENKKHR
ncbi:BlaI/MecI/CopY family transcriptional regulator [Ningiella sp. W23]|uniref:BlaI/MecI/CopY family transcriptional regulator n=1 Tax=Ningiella sp. W23 TaxID=3023715 RepID=UPI003756F09A